MCFSASASFSSSLLLAFVGTETLRKVHKPSQIIFAGIPLYFALQQLTEGVVWMTLAHPGHAESQKVAACCFKIMAEVIWPILIPLSVFLMEENKIRKRILFALLTLGVAVTFYYLYFIVFYDIHTEIIGRHISYQSSVQGSFDKISMLFYLFATLTPFFVSSIKKMPVVGAIMAASFAVASYFYAQCLTSVWCFFAAVTSFAIFYLIRDAHKKYSSSLSRPRIHG